MLSLGLRRFRMGDRLASIWFAARIIASPLTLAIPTGTALATEDTVVDVVLAKSEKDLRHFSRSMPPWSSPVRP